MWQRADLFLAGGHTFRSSEERSSKELRIVTLTVYSSCEENKGG